MDGFFALALTNLSSPLILCFVLGVAAALARSDLNFPEAAAKALSLYLLFAIGFKGGVAVSDHGIDLALGTTLFAGIVLSALLPFLAFGLLRVLTNLDRTNAAGAGRQGGSMVGAILCESAIAEPIEVAAYALVGAGLTSLLSRQPSFLVAARIR